jgi:hypothetical protein
MAYTLKDKDNDDDEYCSVKIIYYDETLYRNIHSYVCHFLLYSSDRLATMYIE